ncbi:MAG: thermonuclease family protein [Candidatus Margulisiibacteriota bacterium]|nr:thermonuclease family protein [Candidatus Margulisiibacteriota bacterium]
MTKRSLAIFCLLFIASLFITGFGKPPASAPENIYLVTRVIDGDTIELANGERVRYIGIDTPETKHPEKPVQYFGKEAYEANKKLVEGKKVRLEFDVQKRDKYGRILAYVYVDNIFVNAWLVENGYAYAATYPPNVKYQESFLKLQKEARKNKRRLWRGGQNQ